MMDRNEHGFKLGPVKTRAGGDREIFAFTAEGEPGSERQGRLHPDRDGPGRGVVPAALHPGARRGQWQ